MIVGENDDKLWRLLEEYTPGARLETDYSEVTQIGIDETNQKKNHNHVSLFVDLEEKRTIHVSEEKSSETVEDFAKYFRLRQIDIHQIFRCKL